MDKKCEKCSKECKQHVCVVTYCPNYAPKSCQDAPNLNDLVLGTPTTLKTRKWLKLSPRGSKKGEK